MARRSLLVGVVALALACSACAVDVQVTVKVDQDGSGVVRVDVEADADAVQTVEVNGGTLETRVRLTDLPAAGWTVGPWTREADGSASITLRKPFTSPDQVSGILEELSGRAGPLRDASFTRRRSILNTRTAAKVTVDLGRIGTGVTADGDLVARLVEQGVDVGALDQQLLGLLRDSVAVRLVVELPDGQRTEITPAPGRAATLEASASVLDVRRLALLVAGVVLLGVAIAVALWPRKRRVRRRRHEPTYATYRRGAAAHRALSREEATRERTPRGSAAPRRRRRR